ncbi:MAG: DNA polymerase/3'-5' exonuclease PolX [Minisyncoccia bacterium]
MSNKEIAKILREISIYLEMDEVPFKPQAYEKAAFIIEDNDQELSEIYKEQGIKGIENIAGIGKSIAEKIQELLTTGKLKYYEDLKKKIPVDVSNLMLIEGLGPKTIKNLYEKLGIKNISDLEKAAREHKIRNLEGFGEKSELKILKGIEFLKHSQGRFILWYMMDDINKLYKRLSSLKEVQKITIAGSVRRHKETIGDIDILIVSGNPKSIMDYFVSMPEVINIYAHGDTKSSIKIKSGIDVDLRVVPAESYGAALNYFTGSKEHNIALRELALKHRWKLNEYGLFKANKMIAGKTEEEIYKKLGLDYVEPELRENTGEIQAAQNHTLPHLIKYGSLKGDLQVQTNWSDGANSIEEMAKAAIDLGLEYIAITDHTKRLAMANGLDEKRIQQQWKEIDKINLKLKKQNIKFKILKSTECDILKDGTLDLPDKILSKLDVVGVSIHSYFNLSKLEQTKRIKKALANPNVDILFHPTGRIINKREPYEIDIEQIIDFAKKQNKILEIDAYPERSDLKDEYIKKCVEKRVKMSIDSDAHHSSHFKFLEYGISQARRGWATEKDIINTLHFEKFISSLNH